MDSVGEFDVRPAGHVAGFAQSAAFVDQTVAKQPPASAGPSQREGVARQAHSKTSLIEMIALILVYFSCFFWGFLCLCVLEIRQANVPAFTSLVAILDQQKRLQDQDHGLAAVLEKLAGQLTFYREFLYSISCSELEMVPLDNIGALTALGAPAADNDGNTQNANAPPSCHQLREMIKAHIRALVATEDEAKFKFANLGFWYQEYIDGLKNQAPQLVPVIPFLILPLRSPFEILEMMLIVCAGVLGGIMGVIRFVFDPSVSKPSGGDLVWKPFAGGLTAFGIFILYRAGQLLVGGQTQDGNGTSIGVFLLALIGLVSGLCAKEAINQIEYAATHFLRRRPAGVQNSQDGPSDAQGPNSTAAQAS